MTAELRVQSDMSSTFLTTVRIEERGLDADDEAAQLVAGEQDIIDNILGEAVGFATDAELHVAGTSARLVEIEREAAILRRQRNEAEDSLRALRQHDDLVRDFRLSNWVRMRAGNHQATDAADVIRIVEEKLATYGVTYTGDHQIADKQGGEDA